MIEQDFRVSYRRTHCQELRVLAWRFQSVVHYHHHHHYHISIKSSVMRDNETWLHFIGSQAMFSFHCHYYNDTVIVLVPCHSF